jgi:hypothetical protein
VGTQTIPDTRGGRIFRLISTVVLVAAIIGIADQVRTLFWILLTGEGRNPARVVLMLIGWSLLCWSGYNAHRHNLAPPTWLVMLIPVLIWIYVLWPS